MTISRKEFLKLAGGLAGGLALEAVGRPFLVSRAADIGEGGNQIMFDLGSFPQPSPESFFFDEHKYSPLKRELEPSEWSATNRHLPIEIDPAVINRPGERSQVTLERVVEYTGFRSPRYVASSGERVSMCNIAAWDWSRALQVHLPHWMGETEMSANMLFRWITHSQAGGVYGEGWQPVGALAAQLLANRGIPVFALAENPSPGRHGHVAMVYPKRLPPLLQEAGFAPDFATVKSGRSGNRGNGIMGLQSAFRHLRPTYFVHRHDFVLHKQG